MARKRTRKRSCSETLPQVGDFGMCLYALSYCQQLEMLHDRLDQHTPPDSDAMTESERTHVEYAKRYIKAARSSLAGLMDDYTERERSK